MPYVGEMEDDEQINETNPIEEQEKDMKELN